MVIIEYFDGDNWVPAGGPFGSVAIALMSLGGDNYNYRILDKETKKVLWVSPSED